MGAEQNDNLEKEMDEQKYRMNKKKHIKAIAKRTILGTIVIIFVIMPLMPETSLNILEIIWGPVFNVIDNRLPLLHPLLENVLFFFYLVGLPLLLSFLVSFCYLTYIKKIEIAITGNTLSIIKPNREQVDYDILKTDFYQYSDNRTYEYVPWRADVLVDIFSLGKKKASPWLLIPWRKKEKLVTYVGGRERTVYELYAFDEVCINKLMKNIQEVKEQNK